MQYTPKLNIHGETPEKTLGLHGFYIIDTAEKSEEYSSSWHRTPDSAAAPQRIWLQTSPVLTCEPGLPSRRSMENIILDQCSYEAVHMAGPKRFTQIARHNLDVFEGGGPVKCWQAFICLTASYLQDFILVGPLILYGISFIFLKNAGGRSILSIAFLKKCKKMKKMSKK